MNLIRKAYCQLSAWKSKESRMPIVIRGLRQIGKSYLAERFAYENYGEEYCPVLDFRHNKSLSSIFQSDFGMEGMTVESIVANMKTTFPNKKIEKGKTCIVMDEIGDCPLARESFKVFGDHSGYDIIATGSLLGLSQIRGNINDIPIGYEEYLDMKPLDFEEFLQACGADESVFSLLDKSADSFEAIPETAHLALSAYLRRYIVVGGMPKAVLTYLNTRDANEVREVQIALRKDYEDDFGKIRSKKGEMAIDAKLLVRTIRAYRSIPDQLAKENKKFKYSSVEGGGRSSEFSDALAWLGKADIVTLAHNLRAIESPLEGNAISEEFKVYPTDIGLLVSNYPAATLKQILDGDLGAYKGAIYEGLAADMLYKSGFPLYYYSDTKKHLENDFLIETKDGIVVIESKATNGKMASSKALMSGESPYVVNNVYKMGSSNFGKGSYYQGIPQYALPFVLKKIQKQMHDALLLDELPVLKF